MGLRDRIGNRGAEGARFQMRQQLLSVGDDYWIETEGGERAYRVDGKAARVRDTWVLEDAAGNEVATIREHKLSVRDAIHIEMGGRTIKVKKAVVGIRDRFSIDVEGGDDLSAHGNVVDHEYTIERQHGDKVAEVSKKWFRVRETYGVEVEPDVDPALVLAVTVAIDGLSDPH